MLDSLSRIEAELLAAGLRENARTRRRTPAFTRRSLTIVLVTLATGGAGAGLWVGGAATGGPARHEKTQAATFASTSQGQGGSKAFGDAGEPGTVDPRLTWAFAFLRRPRTDGDALPARDARRVTANNPFAVDPDRSRLIATSGSERVFAIPGSGGMCIKIIGRGGAATGTCSPVAAVSEGGTFIAEYCSRPRQPALTRVIGVAPDDVASVQLRRAGQTVATAPVNDNLITIASAGDVNDIVIGSSIRRLEPSPTRC